MSREVQRSLLLHKHVTLKEIYKDVKSGDSLDFLAIWQIITLEYKMHYILG